MSVQFNNQNKNKKIFVYMNDIYKVMTSKEINVITDNLIIYDYTI